MIGASETERHIGLAGATGVGVGAIVGGGILALAGVAFTATGPAAMLAFGLNGIIALLTALSFAEMASKFPESGGTYTFSKKVLSVEAAFAVGWVVWFASIVASVLYAVGFAYFALVMIGDLWQALHGSAPDWLTGSRSITGVAFVTTVALGFGLTRKAAGGGQLVNVGKVVDFGVLILGGLWAFWHLEDFLTPTQGGGPGAGLAAFFRIFPMFFLMVIALAIILTWVFNHTRGSVFIAITAHASVDNPEVVLVPLFLTIDYASLILAGLVGFGVAALLIVILTRGQLGYQPSPEQPLATI